MDWNRIDGFATTLAALPTRRTLLGLGGAGLLGALGLDSIDARKKTKKCKKCGPCEKCQKGKCKPKSDDTACLGTGKCLAGQCNPLPICVRALDVCPPDSYPVECCSGHCTFNPPFVGCSFSGPGGLCVDSGDCGPGGTCVGYRCQAA